MAHKAELLAHITLAFPVAAKAATVCVTPCYTRNFWQTKEDMPKLSQSVSPISLINFLSHVAEHEE